MTIEYVNIFKYLIKVKYTKHTINHSLNLYQRRVYRFIKYNNNNESDFASSEKMCMFKELSKKIQVRNYQNYLPPVRYGLPHQP